MAESGAHFEYEIVRTQRPPRTWIARHNFLSTFDNRIIALALAEATSIIFAAFASKLLYIDLLLGQAQPIWPYLAPAPLLAVTLYLSLKRAGLYGAGALLQPVVAYGRIFGELVKWFPRSPWHLVHSQGRRLVLARMVPNVVRLKWHRPNYSTDRGNARRASICCGTASFDSGSRCTGRWSSSQP